VVSLRDKLSAARERGREARELNRQALQEAEARMRRITKAARLRSQGVSVPQVSGEPDPSVTEEDLDAMLAAEKQRRADLYDEFVRVGRVTIFRDLGVQILAGDDQVYTIGDHDPFAKVNDSRLLGPLAGAEARVTDGTSAFSWGKAVVMPLATAPLARKETADALVVFPDGTVHTAGLDGSRAVRDARRQCIEFNALAGSAAPAVTGDTGPNHAVRLQKLQDLLAAGLLSQEEFDIKRAQIIDSI
jgi:hypothetical protein